MGSCGNMTFVDEPSREVASAAAAEQHLCSESMGKLVSEQRDCVVIDSNGDCASGPGEDENSACKKSGDIDCKVGIKGEAQIVGSGMKGLMGGECCENSVRLKKNGGEIADASCSKALVGDMCGDSVVCSENNQGELMGDSGLKELMDDGCRDCIVYSIENQGEKVDGSSPHDLRSDTYGDSTVCSIGNQCENVDGASSKELMGDICGMLCLNDNQGENPDCSGPGELLGYVDNTGYSNEIQCEHVASGLNELKGDRISDHGVGLNENQDDADIHYSVTDVYLEKSGASGEDGAIAAKGSLGLSQDKDTASLSSGMEISTKCEDQMKGDNENVVGLMFKECMGSNQGRICLTENMGIGDHHDSENDVTQNGEMPSEPNTVSTSPRNSVKLDKQDDDERVNGSILQRIVEYGEKKFEEKNGAVKRKGTDVLNEILPSENFKGPFELIHATGEHKSKDGTGTYCSSLEVAMEEKREVLTEVEANICNQMSSIQGNHLAATAVGIGDCRSDCPRQNDLKDSNTIMGPSLDGESGASPMIESDMRGKISTSCCIETISNLQQTGDSVGSCDGHNQKDDPSSSDFSLESFTKPVETKSNDDLCIELLASRRFFDTQKNAHTVGNDISGSSGVGVAEVSEGRTDFLAYTKAEISSEIIINAKGKACNSNKDSFEPGANCLSDKSTSLSCQPVDVVDSGLSGRLDPLDLLAKDACAAISSSSSIDCSGQRENEGKDIVKADCVLETKNCPTTSSSSRKGRQKSKSSRKAPAKRGTRNCSSTKLHRPHESIEFLFKASRRKRSCSSKPARSSIWGLFSNIAKFIESCPDPSCNGVQNREPSKARGGRGSGKRSKNRAGQNRKESSGLSNSLTSCLRLKIKVGKEVAPSNVNSLVAEVVDPSVLIGSSFSNYGKETNLQYPTVANVVEDKVELGSEMQFQSKEDQEMMKTCSDAFLTEVKLANKAVRCSENLEKISEDATDSSLISQSDAVAEASQEAIENKCLDPGTSPDSEVINTIPDAQIGLIHQEESLDTVLNTSGALASPRGAKTSKGSKRGKKDNHRSPGAASTRKVKSSKSRRSREKTTGNGLVSSEALISSSAANSSRENWIGVSKEATEKENSMDIKDCCSPDVPDTKNTKNFSSSNSKRNQLSKTSRSPGASKGKSRVSDSVKSRKGNGSKQKGDESKSVSNSKVKEKCSDEEIVARGGKSPVTGTGTLRIYVTISSLLLCSSHVIVIINL